jgi:hypothetical protein
MTIARSALQTLREGNNYLQFKNKLLSLHLAGNDIGSMNHSSRFIRGFVHSMINLMDKLISEHFDAIDPVTCRKRIFAFMADKVTELHRIGDAIALMLMPEKGELHAIFIDYLLVAGHTGDALNREIYDNTFLK